MFFQMSLKKCPVSMGSFSKLHMGRFFKVSGFAKGRKMLRQEMKMKGPSTGHEAQLSAGGDACPVDVAPDNGWQIRQEVLE